MVVCETSLHTCFVLTDTEEEFDSDDEQDALKSFMGSLQSNTTQ